MRMYVHAICVCNMHVYILTVFGPIARMQKSMDCMYADCMCTTAYNMHATLVYKYVLAYRIQALCMQSHVYTLQAGHMRAIARNLHTCII